MVAKLYNLESTKPRTQSRRVFFYSNFCGITKKKMIFNQVPYKFTLVGHENRKLVESNQRENTLPKKHIGWNAQGLLS